LEFNYEKNSKESKNRENVKLAWWSTFWNFPTFYGFLSKSTKNIETFYSVDQEKHNFDFVENLQLSGNIFHLHQKLDKIGNFYVLAKS